MPKRSRIKKVTRESIALKKMRVAKGLGQRDAAEVIGVASTRVNHCENGRAEISEEYIDNFIEALGYSRTDWREFLENRGGESDTKKLCRGLLDELSDDKIRAIFLLLTFLK